MFHVCFSLVCYFVCPLNFVMTCLEKADHLALLCVMFSSVLLLLYVVSWVKCGI